MALFKTKKQKLEEKVRKVQTPPTKGQKETKYVQERKEITSGKRNITGRGIGLHWKKSLDEDKKKKVAKKK